VALGSYEPISGGPHVLAHLLLGRHGKRGRRPGGWVAKGRGRVGGRKPVVRPWSAVSRDLGRGVTNALLARQHRGGAHRGVAEEGAARVPGSAGRVFGPPRWSILAIDGPAGSISTAGARLGSAARARGFEDEGSSVPHFCSSSVRAARPDAPGWVPCSTRRGQPGVRASGRLADDFFSPPAAAREVERRADFFFASSGFLAAACTPRGAPTPRRGRAVASDPRDRRPSASVEQHCVRGSGPGMNPGRAVWGQGGWGCCRMLGGDAYPAAGRRWSWR